MSPMAILYERYACHTWLLLLWLLVAVVKMRMGFVLSSMIGISNSLVHSLPVTLH